jgi:hypothetical protein
MPNRVRMEGQRVGQEATRTVNRVVRNGANR